MARFRRKQRSGGRRSSSRTAWIEAPTSVVAGTLTSANLSDTLFVYDFASAEKFADNYGGGDWRIERILGSFGATAVQNTGGVATIVKICFGLGMASGPASVALSVDVTDIGLPFMSGNPELSWLVQVCCYINVSTLEVERCEFDVRGRRKIGVRSRMFSVVATPAMTVNDSIEYEVDFRTLLRMRTA